MTTITTRAGKNSPLSNVEVDGNFNNLNTAKLELGQAQSSGTANGVLYLNGSKQVASGTGLVFDGGSLGVGINPSFTLDVNGVAYLRGTAFVGGGTGTTRRLGFDASGTYYNWIDNDTGFMRFAVSDTEQMRLTNTGLGIGTSSPSNRLTVIGPSSEATNLLTSSTNAAVLIRPFSGSSWATAIGSISGQIQYIQGVAAEGDAARDLVLQPYGGNVGIGTSSPYAKLHVYGSVDGTFSSIVENASSGASAQARSQYVSTGCTLLVGSTNDASLGGGAFLYATGAKPITFWNNNLERARIDSSGNLLVGTTSAVSGSKLVVDGGDATVYGITVGRGAGAVSTNTAVGASALQANTTGASNSAFGLNALYANTTGDFNTAVGTSALQANTASYNTALGFRAAYLTTTGIGNLALGAYALNTNTTGSGNTAVGNWHAGSIYSALYSNTTGVNNVAVGSGALSSNSTGGYNSALGYGALASNTTASNNTAVGYQAGYSNVTGTQNAFFGRVAGYSNIGSYNVFLGDGAAYNNTSGQFNVAVGQSALLSNTTASYNTAVGYQAAYSNTTTGPVTALGYQAAYTNNGGTDITAVGWKALFSNTTGYNNNAFGTDALYGNTTGLWNSAFGHGSLYTNTTGSYNVAIGPLALRSNTTASNNTAVGYQAGYANTTGGIDAFGYQAGRANTTGNGNAAFGLAALTANTTGIDNTAIGAGAYGARSASMQSNTTGSYNTAVGASSLQANTTGNYNTAIGREALQANTTASNNTAVGYQAGYSNTTGEVTAVGYGAARSNTTGAGNNVLGVQALNSNTTGSNNAVVGGNAMLLNTTGSYNVAMGQEALLANTTASKNAAVGYQAGYSNTTGDGNTYVGWQAGYASTTAYVNTFIGYGAGSTVTTGIKNTILGAYNGNQGGLDIRTASNNIVLSDGDGNPRLINRGGTLAFGVGANPSNWLSSLPVHQLGSASWLGSSTQSLMSVNYYTDGSSDKFIQDGPATTAYQYNGAHQLWGTDSGVAGNTISWTNLLTVKKGETVALQGGSTGVAGTGITFPATQNASSDANTLDDYEEGTWTPYLTVEGGTSSIPADTIQDARYTKIGRAVTVSCSVVWNNYYLYGGTSALRIVNLPFPVVTTGSGGVVCGTGIWESNNITGSPNTPFCFALTSSSTSTSDVYLMYTQTGAGYSYIRVGNIPLGSSNGTFIVRMVFQYQTAT